MESLPLFVAAVLFAFFFSPHCTSSLSLDDSFLSSSSLKRQQEVSQRSIPGIWKLTTDALPYELDIRSKLNKRFSNESNSNSNSGNEENSETILLRLNQDGTFKQYDEGYREGKWVTGRWKLQLVESSATTNDFASSSTTNQPMSDKSRNRSDDKALSWLLLLAMNRQYFGPPYDVLLEATTNTTMIGYENSSMASKSGSMINASSTSTTSSRTRGSGDERPKEQEFEDEIKEPPKETSSQPLKCWQGVARKGKFLRPAPGKHPLDRERISTGSEILADSESLGIFLLKRALSITSIDQKQMDAANSSSKDGDKHSSSTSEESATDSTSIVNENDGTFFFPCSSGDDGGVLQ